MMLMSAKAVGVGVGVGVGVLVGMGEFVGMGVFVAIGVFVGTVGHGNESEMALTESVGGVEPRA